MKQIAAYIRSEWKYWLAAIFVTVAIGHSAAAEAKPIPQQVAGQFTILYDEDYSMWYLGYRKVHMPIGDTFDAIKIHWTGTYKGSSFILLSGQQGRMCEQAFRLYWTDEHGTIREDRDFGTCYASSISASFVRENLIIKLDGRVHTIPLW